jgi:hypothetical protein
MDKLPVCVNARLDKSGDMDGYRVKLAVGQTLVARVEAYSLGSGVDIMTHVLDEQGVRVQLPDSDPVTVGADLVQAVELVPASGKSMTAEKFRSLTMLPRSQRQQPPTHVLRSVQLFRRHHDHVTAHSVSAPTFPWRSALRELGSLLTQWARR